MNAKIEGFFRFEGTSLELEPFLTDIADVFVKHGFGNNAAAADDDLVSSMIVLKDSGANTTEDPDAWLKEATEEAATILIPLNKNEEKDSE